MIEFIQRQCLCKNATLVFWYFDSALSVNSSTEQALFAFISQLVRQNPSCIHHIKRVWEAKRDDATDMLTINDRMSLFNNIKEHYDHIFVVVDALDEAKDPIRMCDVFQSLAQGGATVKCSVIITSRNDITLENMLKPLSPLIAMVLDGNKLDLKDFIDRSIVEMIKRGKMRFRKQSLIDDTRETLLNRSGGLFLQAKFHLEFLSKMKSDKALMTALKCLPSALDDSYEYILSRIMIEHVGSLSEARRMLIWLSHAVEAPSPNMLAEVAAINDDDEYLDQDAIPTDPEDLVSILGSLVGIDRSVHPPVVSLSHLSLFEYLHSEAIKNSSVSAFYIDATQAHRYISKVCGQYLGYSNFVTPLIATRKLGEGSSFNPGLPRKKWLAGTAVGRRPVFKRADRARDEVLERLQEHALLQYAALHWPCHVKLGYTHTMKADLRDAICSPLLAKFAWFLSPQSGSGSNFNSWYEIHHSFCCHLDDCEEYHSPFVLSVVMGVGVLFDALFTGQEDLNGRLPGGWTLLTAAAY